MKDISKDVPYGVMTMKVDKYHLVSDHYHFINFLDESSNTLATVNVGMKGDEVKVFLEQNVKASELNTHNPNLTDTLEYIKNNNHQYNLTVVKSNAFDNSSYTDEKYRVLGLDYIRKPLHPDFNFDKMSEYLTEKNFWSYVQPILQPAIDNKCYIHFFGDIFYDSPNNDPGCVVGIHDIHLNQNNTGRFVKEDRINGDGAIIIDNGDNTYGLILIKFVLQYENNKYYYKNLSRCLIS